MAPAILGAPVTVPAPGEYVALGAARQAAWALSGAAEPPTWKPPAAETHDAEPTPLVREAYAHLRDRTSDWN
jgi:xylulokinase